MMSVPQRKEMVKSSATKELLFLYLEMLSGGTCGADVLAKMAGKYGGSTSSIWNYIYHTGWALFRAPSAQEHNVA